MYVLSIIRPPENGAAFGKAEITEVVTHVQYAADLAGDMLIAEGVRTMEARSFATALAHELAGTQRVHTGTGLTFRIDPADNPPNVCPCCSRLVLPGDTPYAGQEDALCTGCYTWDDTTQCLPSETAHPKEP